MPETAVLPVLDPSTLNPPLQPALITAPHQLPQVTDFLSRVSTFGWDIETNVVPDFTTRRIRTVQVGDRNEQYVIDLLPFAGSSAQLMKQGHCVAPDWALPILDVLGPALTSDSHLKVGHNLQFEYESFRWCMGMRSWGFYDTMLVEKLIHCGAVGLYTVGFFGMADLVRRYFKKEMSKEEQKSFDMETPLTEAQVVYAALDTRTPLALMAAQKPVIERGGLGRVVKIENDCIPAISDMHVNGMLLDKEAWMRIVESTEIEHAANVEELDKYFLEVVGGKDKPLIDLKPLEESWRGAKDSDKRKIARKAYQAASRTNKKWQKDSQDWEGEAAINYASDDQVLLALHRRGYTKQELPASHDKLLRKFEKDPAVAALRKYRGTRHTLDYNGRDFLKWISPITGRVHPEIQQVGAATGRTGSRKPNGQNIEEVRRKCFVARNGWSIITTDMSGAELRIMAELADDDTWIEAFANDWDVHSIVAQSMDLADWAAAAEEECRFAVSKKKCKCKAHLESRNQKKEISFGIPFGLEANSLADKLGVTPKQAQVLLKGWHDANSKISKFLEAAGNDTRMRLQARTFSGRRRLFEAPDWNHCSAVAKSRWVDKGNNSADFRDQGTRWLFRNDDDRIRREGKNLKMQGGCADIAKVAMNLMWFELPKYHAELINFVHDEFVVECPIETAESCRDMIGDCIRRAGAEFMTKVIMESEAHIGPRWEKG